MHRSSCRGESQFVSIVNLCAHLLTRCLNHNKDGARARAHIVVLACYYVLIFGGGASSVAKEESRGKAT